VDDVREVGSAMNNKLAGAVYTGNMELVKLLVTDVTEVRDYPQLLRSACLYGRFDIVKFLITEQGAEITEEAIRWASWNGHEEVLNYLNKQLMLKKIEEI